MAGVLELAARRRQRSTAALAASARRCGGATEDHGGPCSAGTGARPSRQGERGRVEEVTVRASGAAEPTTTDRSGAFPTRTATLDGVETSGPGGDTVKTQRRRAPSKLADERQGRRSIVDRQGDQQNPSGVMA